MTGVRHHQNHGWRAGLLALLLWWPHCSAPAAESSATALEYKVKAAFLLNFARFVEWPPSAAAPTNPIVIGIIGEDPFGDTLAQLIKDQTAQGHPIVIQHYAAGAARPTCQILFISRSLTSELAKELLQSLRGQAVLTVSEQDSFIKHGGMVGFVLVDKTVRFDVNARAAEEAGLILSSKLLKVAHTVIKPR